jgi:hypothetical protein
VSLQADIAARLVPWIDLLGTVVRDNPSVDIYDTLARPDISGLLDTGLANAQALAESALDEAWPPDSSPYRASLADDMARVFFNAAVVLRNAAVTGFHLSPEDMIRQVTNAAWRLGFRCDMSVEVAPVRRQGEQALAEADRLGPEWEVKWVCRKLANGQPDRKVCHWCRRLDAMGPIPVGAEFPAGDPVDGRRPPRVYFNLRCPPFHPRCRCVLMLVSAGSSAPLPALSGEVPFVSADDIRAMPADRYHSLTDFHRAALHELGQVIRRHRQIGGT